MLHFYHIIQLCLLYNIFVLSVLSLLAVTFTWLDCFMVDLVKVAKKFSIAVEVTIESRLYEGG